MTCGEILDQHIYIQDYLQLIKFLEARQETGGQIVPGHYYVANIITYQLLLVPF